LKAKIVAVGKQAGGGKAIKVKISFDTVKYSVRIVVIWKSDMPAVYKRLIKEVSGSKISYPIMVYPFK